MVGRDDYLNICLFNELASMAKMILHTALKDVTVNADLIRRVILRSKLKEIVLVIVIL